MTGITKPFLLLAGVIVICPNLSSEEEVRGRSSRALKAVSDGYLANRNAFHDIHCRFQMTCGRARNIESALNGHVDAELLRSITWDVSGGKLRYTVSCENGVPANSAGKGRRDGMESDLCRAESILTEGRHVLKYAPILKGANISPP